MSRPFGDYYAGKTVLVTGASGFKGSWLSIWLTHLGARVVGYSHAPPTRPSNFEVCGVGDRIIHVEADIRDFETLYDVFQQHRPEVVFHLAAQPLVRLSYEETRYTFDTNLMGTVNALEAARLTDCVRSVVAISSDKCYKNVGSIEGYREDDRLGGYDPYSSSKACAELAISVYQDARFQASGSPPSDVAIASTRAGNVIGGGDWAEDRIVPDTVRAIASDSDIVVRNPEAIRPWQHVLEPLSSYLLLGALLTKDRKYRSAWNIGPDDDSVPTVADVVEGILQRWPSKTRLVIEQDRTQREAKLLRLDCSKAHDQLGWRPAWSIERTLDAIVSWYRDFYSAGPKDMYAVATRQIEEYVQSAVEKGLPWASDES